MHGIDEIKRMNREATVKAYQAKRQPLIAWGDGDRTVLKCPDLGDYVPEGWERTSIYFVDFSGFGGGNEPALTVGQFLENVKSGYGYALGEQGQFRVHVHEYKKIKTPKLLPSENQEWYKKIK